MDNIVQFKENVGLLTKNVANVIRGKEETVSLIIISFIAGGHVLIEDVPGVGKTMIARSIANSIKCDFKRVQFTNDLLPGDILGSYIYNKQSERFEFIQGPIFTNILLADEINRGTPRVQSALLEAMEEQTVSLDRDTFKLPDPFFVIATENPIEQSGTFSLPEAELDRFMIRIRIGYPTKKEEMKMLESVQLKHPIEDLKQIKEIDIINQMKDILKNIKVSEDIRSYIIDLLQATRDSNDLILGGSPRSAIAIQRLSQGMAGFEGRDYVIPDDIKKVLIPVLSHRVKLTPQARINNLDTEKVLKGILDNVKTP